MNKVLYVARRASGLTEEQLAKALRIELAQYLEVEASVKDISSELAIRAAKLFNVDPELFIFEQGQQTRILKVAMDELSEILKAGIFDQMPPRYYFSLISLGNKALMLQAELNHALYRQYELEKDNEVIKSLYRKVSEEK